jgi:hypothetical protein
LPILNGCSFSRNKSQPIVSNKLRPDPEQSAELELVLAVRETRSILAPPGNRRPGKKVKVMALSRLFKNSIGTAALAGLLAAPLLAQVQPYSPSDQYGPPPDQQQYAPDQEQAPPPPNQQQYGQDQQQYAPDQQGAGAPPAGAPQDISQAPPPIPNYDQPSAPGDGYIWTPGYWAWTADGYVWVNGAWVMPPYVSALWTPGYWGYNPYGYFWNAGYWGPYIGYYGGINYGWGYFGTGFYGGYWHGGRFWYNRAYNHIGGGFHNVYNRSYAGFSGRPGGASFSHNNYRGSAYAGARGSAINGRSYGSGYAQNRSNYAARSTSGQARTNYSAPRGNYSAPHTNYSAPRGNSSAPHANYSAPRSSGGGGGGGFHGGGGGGGGSHGGGGGGHR